jgi:pimeloyl-ACP methyl ester carboxylesterase
MVSTDQPHEDITETMPTRHLTPVDDCYWHYRQQGDPTADEAIVLFHASPRHSAMFAPLMADLAEAMPHRRVIAPDTPGYGLTDPLPTPPHTLADYLPHFQTFFQSLGLRRITLYGTATGAQLGIAYAYTYPNDIAHLLLDNACHFTNTEREAILTGYFPDLKPRPDGSHLQRAWQMAEGLAQFFPWFRADEAHRIGSPPLPEQTHQAVLELLQAGPAYADAYRAAFQHERAENVHRLTVPTTLFRWQGSMLLPHIDALIASGLPKNVKVVETPAPMAERFRNMVKCDW